MFIETDTKSPQAKSKGASFDISVRPAIPALGRAPSTTSPSCIPPPQQPSHSIINHQSSAARNHPAGASGASPHGSPSGVTAPTKFTPSGTVAASSANSTGSDPPAGVSPAELSSSSSPPPHPPPPPPVASASAPAQPPAPTIPIHIPPQASLDFVDRLMTPPSGYPTETRRRGRQATACLECNRRKQKCDRLQPCHHCAKRNLVDGCVYPDAGKPVVSYMGGTPSSPESPSTPLRYVPPPLPMPGAQKRKGVDSPGFTHKRERRSDELNDGFHTAMSSGTRTARTNSDDSTHSMGSRSERSHRSQASLDSNRSSQSSGSSSEMSSSHADSTMTSINSERLQGSFTPQTPLPPLPTSLPPTARPLNRTIPVSSERHEIITPPPPDGQHGQWLHYSPGSERGRDWRPEAIHAAVSPHRMSIDSSHPSDNQTALPQAQLGDGPQPRHQASNANGRRTPPPGPLDRRGSVPRIDDHLMQEGGAPGIGSLAKEGAEQHGSQFQFYGTSHFGPRLAAQVVHDGKSNVDVSDSQYRSSSGDDELLHQIRQLDSALPKRSLCRLFVTAFFEKYNSWVDILYAPDFQSRHDEFWVTHSEFEDLTRIDLRWFALFHTILAFGSLLDDSANLDLNERRAISDKCFVAARRALSEAPSFYGESLDTVAAYTLLSLYLVAMRRMPESWHMVGSGVRAAQAQGFHVDGETWHLLPKDAELWRRLWAQMYILDRSISYFLGRPLAIQDGSFTTHSPANMHDSELEILPRRDWPLTKTTRSTFLVLHYKLAQIIGQILTKCFGLNPRNHADVMDCEKLMVEWQESLPPVFRIDDPDTSLDETYPWVKLQRRTLMSKFHQARISLHRPYLLPSGRNDYAQSRLCCVLSAGVELRHRLSLLATDHDPFDRFKWLTVASGFSPACVLGLLLARAQREKQFNYDNIRSLLVEYITVEKNNTLRRDRTLENELAVLDMMLAQANEVDAHAQRSLRTSKAPTRVPTPTRKRSIPSMSTQSVGQQQPPQAQTYPPSTPATLSPTIATSSANSNVNVNANPNPSLSPTLALAHPQPRIMPTTLLPDSVLPVQDYTYSQHLTMSPPLTGAGYANASNPYTTAPQSSFINPTGAFVTLAPAPQYDDPRWFTFPSPMDPSADTFPPVHDMGAWAGLLESIGPTDWADEN